VGLWPSLAAKTIGQKDQGRAAGHAAITSTCLAIPTSHHDSVSRVVALGTESGKVDLRMKSKRFRDPVIEAYMAGVDRTLLRENLKLSPAQRLEKLVRFSDFAAKLRRAGERARRPSRAR
jgi:hypothetical protein